MLAPFGRVMGLGGTVKDYLRPEGAPMFWPQIMQSGLYARVKSLEPRDFVAVFGDPFRRGVGFVDRCRIMRLGRWRVVHEYGGETAIDHKVADEARWVGFWAESMVLMLVVWWCFLVCWLCLLV
jgi:hypothetical protein